MKRFKSCIFGAAMLCAAAGLPALADDQLPGQVDFGSFSPPKDGQYVEVNVPSSLIHLASQIVAKDEPEVAKTLDGLKLVKVTVIGVDDQNRTDLQKRADKVRKDLSGDGWQRVVMVQEKGQDVNVYIKMDPNGAIQGLTAVVIDDKDQAVFANVVGSIKPEQLAMLGDQLHIDPLKKLGIAKEKHEQDHGDQKAEADKNDDAKAKDTSSDKQ